MKFQPGATGAIEILKSEQFSLFLRLSWPNKSMTESSYDELILKLLSKEISSEEKHKLMLWANESAEHKKHLEEMKNVWEISGKSEEQRDFQTAEEWKKFQMLLDKVEESNSVNFQSSRVRTLNTSVFYKVAATVLLLIIAGIAFYQLNQQDLLTKESGNNEISFLLSDGTKVWLNKHSKLEYPETFKSNTRTVTLSGEAFFSVQKNPDKPFIVVTEDANVQVLGTSFNVEAYPQNKIVEVIVQSGKVELSSKMNEALVLEAGTTGILDKEDLSITRQSLMDPNNFAWKTRKLVFDKVKLNEVLDALQDYYSIKIEVSNPKILKCRFTSTFEDVKLEEVMQALSISLDLKIKYDGKAYVINGEGCN